MNKLSLLINTFIFIHFLTRLRLSFTAFFKTAKEFLEDTDLLELVKIGQEYGTTTGRMRTTNWLNLDKLIEAVKISGTTIIIISKIDVIEKINKYKLYYDSKILEFDNFSKMKDFIDKILITNCNLLKKIIYSNTVELKDLDLN